MQSSQTSATTPCSETQLSLKSSLQKWQRPPCNGLAHHQDRVPRGTDAFSSRFQQFIGNVARIDPANCASACVDLSVILDASAISFLKIECRSSTTNSSGVSSSLCRTSWIEPAETSSMKTP